MKIILDKEDVTAVVQLYINNKFKNHQKVLDWAPRPSPQTGISVELESDASVKT